MPRYLARYTSTHIRAVLAERGQTQAWLAGAMGITAEHLSRVLSGKLGMSEWFVNRACEVLGLPEDQLFFVDQSSHSCLPEREAAVS